jgi:hypothetical protein
MQIQLFRKVTDNHRFGDEHDAARFFNMSVAAVRLHADKLPGCWRCGPAIRFDHRAAACYAADMVFATLNAKAADSLAKERRFG